MVFGKYCKLAKRGLGWSWRLEILKLLEKSRKEGPYNTRRGSLTPTLAITLHYRLPFKML